MKALELVYLVGIFKFYVSIMQNQEIRPEKGKIELKKEEISSNNTVCSIMQRILNLMKSGRAVLLP